MKNAEYIKVAFPGEHGAFSEDAVIAFFDVGEPVPCRQIVDVFNAVTEHQVDFGVVPVENSHAGSINETYDFLLAYHLNIFGEINLRVSHNLMALPGQELTDIRAVYSHPQALAQCEEFLNQLNVETIPIYNTAGAAKKIKEEGLLGYGAIAGRRAAQIYGLKMLAEKIETNVRNYTKFFVISKQQAEPAAKNKTSLVFATKNSPGALYACLGAFATRGINLTKLESRPSKNKPWEYIFYVDFEGHLGDKLYHEAIEEMEHRTAFTKVLGSYPSARD